MAMRVASVRPMVPSLVRMWLTRPLTVPWLLSKGSINSGTKARRWIGRLPNPVCRARVRSDHAPKRPPAGRIIRGETVSDAPACHARERFGFQRGFGAVAGDFRFGCHAILGELVWLRGTLRVQSFGAKGKFEARNGE
jgi:hypothetical protein